MQMSMAANVETNEDAFQLAHTAGERYVSAVWKNDACVNDQTPGTCNFADQTIKHGEKVMGTISATNVYTDLIKKCPSNRAGNEYTMETFQSFHFEVTSSGKTTSSRGGEAVQRQGWYVCAPVQQ